MRLRLYNSVFEYRHERIVLSVPVLLRPEADSPQWNGLLQRGFPREEPLSTLRYEVIRVWQVPVEQLLTGGLGTLPLAPISAVPSGEHRRVIDRMKRLSGVKPPQRVAEIWVAAKMLLGLRYDDAFAQALFAEVLGMEESATYQALVRRTRAEEARRLLLMLGETNFGPPDAAVRSALESMDDPAEIEALGIRFVNAGSWQELVPPPSRRRKSRG
jgi:hypothetical protein